MRVIADLGATHFIEAGGSGLTGSIKQSLAPAEAMVVSMLGKDRPEAGLGAPVLRSVFTTGIAGAVVGGVRWLRWTAVQLPHGVYVSTTAVWEAPGADGAADAWPG